jgi:cell division control protein 7
MKLDELEMFKIDFPNSEFEVLEKIGQGTFSSVFKAIDKKHYLYNNANWCRNHERSGKCPGLVALKKIHPTSTPHRIYTELKTLSELSGHPNIAPLITAFRNEDKVVAVLPYFEYDSFKACIKKMQLPDIQRYFHCLLSATGFMHSKGFIHRDIKPSNFLYSIQERTGVLVDFGLAQKSTVKLSSSAASKFKLPKPITKDNIRGRMNPGYILNDTRPSLRADRAGTRGFRAPEVLFRVSQQGFGEKRLTKPLTFGLLESYFFVWQQNSTLSSLPILIKTLY